MPFVDQTARCETNEMAGEAARLAAEVDHKGRLSIPAWLRGDAVIVATFSLVYFTNVLVLAAQKYFWYDELFTVYVSRLPLFGPLWQALAHGADFNPPLFYVITKLSKFFFGETLLGLRLPEIVGFWLFCLSLYVFALRASRSRVAAAVAMSFPMLTGAFYYAYEARPYGLVLAGTGLALVCWQRALDQHRVGRWYLGLSASLLGCFLVHCYSLVVAVPFGLVELYRTWLRRRIDGRMWLALIIPSALATSTYVPLLLSYGALSKGTYFNTLFPANWDQVTKFYAFLLGPCAFVVVCAFALAAIDRVYGEMGSKPVAQRATVHDRTLDTALIVSFLAIPAAGVLLGKLVHGPFFVRYFLPGLAGVCLWSLLSMRSGRRIWTSWALAGLIAFAATRQTAAVLWHNYNHWGENIVEPSTGIPINTLPGQPLAIHPLLRSVQAGSLPLGVPLSLDYLYLLHYAPQLSSRLYFLTYSRDDFDARGFRIVRQWLPLQFNEPLTFEEFLQRFPKSLVYADRLSFWSLSPVGDKGGRIEWLRTDDRHMLAEFAGTGSPTR